MVTLKSSSDSERPSRVVSGFSISHFILECRLFIVWCTWSAFIHQLSGDKGRQQNLLLGLIDKCEKRAMVSSLSMTRIARMPEVGLLFGEKLEHWEKWMVFVTSWLERYSVRFLILSATLVMAFCMGIKVYRNTTSRLDGYGSALLVVKSQAWVRLTSSRLFARCAGTSSSFGLRALASSHEMHWVGYCAYKETPFIKSHVITATNTTSGALHVVSTIASKTTLIAETPLWRNTSPHAKTTSTKALKSRPLYLKTAPRIYAHLNNFT